MQTDKICIGLSKIKLVLVTLGAALLVAVGFLLLWISETQSYYPPAFIKIVSIVSIAFFGICLIFLVFKLFDNKPGLVIDSSGITDNSSITAIGFIPWDTITSIKTIEVYQQKIIAIEVKNPNHLIEKQSDLKKFWLKQNCNSFATPICINTNSLKIKFDELEKLIKEFWRKYKSL
jgi:glucan phosphoethanolaminetransferase (alkaline phosphatase superfamily)